MFNLYKCSPAKVACTNYDPQPIASEGPVVGCPAYQIYIPYRTEEVNYTALHKANTEHLVVCFRSRWLPTTSVMTKGEEQTLMKGWMKS